MKNLIAGNWKMNCTLQEAKELIADIVNAIYEKESLHGNNDFLVCPPYIYLSTIRHAVSSYNVVTFGAQDCSAQNNGAHTGDISAEMLADSGCSYVIIGHSERRSDHGESDAMIAEKAKRLIENKVAAILCVGETAAQREAGAQEEIVGAQLDHAIQDAHHAGNLVIAYEPVWAIGSGQAASTQDILYMHGFIRKKLKERLADGVNIRILYGGSVKPENAADILQITDVNGCLVGGASLKAESFVGIAQAF